MHGIFAKERSVETVAINEFMRGNKGWVLGLEASDKGETTSLPGFSPKTLNNLETFS